MSEYSSIKDFFDDIRSSIQKLFGLIKDDEYDTSSGAAIAQSTPNMYNFTPTKFSMDYTKTIAYFIITFVILIMGKEIGLGTSTITFLGLAVTYTMLSTSLTSSSTIFIFLEQFQSQLILSKSTSTNNINLSMKQHHNNTNYLQQHPPKS